MNMALARRLAALAATGAAAALFAGPAVAARPAAFPLPETLTSTHFRIHYTGDFTLPDERVLQQDAATLASNAEQAYAAFVTGWGYPAPLNDGDGLIDIWVTDLAAGVAGKADVDAAGNTATGWIAVDPAYVKARDVIAHEFFHLVQFGIWIPADSWLLEGSANWAGISVNGYVATGNATLAPTLHRPDLSLDCVGEACGNDLYETAGYSRWSFFEYLSSRYGTGFVKETLLQGAALADPSKKGAALVSAALVARGTTLGDVYSDYTFANLAGNYSVTELKGLAPVSYAMLATGDETASLPVARVGVNHLAVRYLKLVRGDATNTGACYAATLSLAVALPAGLSAKPAVYSKSLTAAVPLTVNGSTASIAIPWDTCTGGYDGFLSLPNPSLTTDAAQFTVSGTLTVDYSQPAAPKGPPDAFYTGPSTPAETAELAPAIFVYGAQVIRVSAATRLVRLIVFSSGAGKLQAAAGSTLLGTVALRAGNNDVRFRLPASMVESLRKTSGLRISSSVLTLTSLSTAGAAGAKVARKLAVAPVKTVKRR